MRLIHRTRHEQEAPRPIYLAGPPGSGKTILGERACQALGLRFLDLPTPNLELIEAARIQQAADVVTLPWELQLVPATFARCRQTGSVIALWSHPLEMQARSGRTLFTPVKRLSTHGGFGCEGTGCPEFRKLDRACDHVLLLRGLSIEKASALLQELIEEMRAPASGTPAEQVGIAGSAKEWTERHGADAEEAALIVDAMARFALHLKERGASPRTMSAVYSDLNAAGLLVAMNDIPRTKKKRKADPLRRFHAAPHTYEFRRMLSDSPRLQRSRELTRVCSREMVHRVGW